jgi:hypothetical protein
LVSRQSLATASDEKAQPAQLAGREHQQAQETWDQQTKVKVHRGPEAVRQNETRLEMKMSKNPIKSVKDKIYKAEKGKGFGGGMGKKCSCGKAGCSCGKKMSGLFGKKAY